MGAGPFHVEVPSTDGPAHLRPHHWYQFQAETGHTYLHVYGTDGKVEYFDDDGGDGYASFVEYTADSDTTVVFDVGTHSPWDTGTYDVTVTGAAAAAGKAGSASLGERASRLSAATGNMCCDGGGL